MKRSLISQRATRVGTICALAMLGSLGAASRAASLVVQTEGGAVEGNVAMGVENFLDIPYAAPPVGELRWSPPQPPAHWSDVRPAREYGSYCPQPKTLDSANQVVNEDCLDVNIQRPIGTRGDAKLPVYVYIHRGGYVTGSGNKDGQDTSPLVGVTLNYRLGALGFLALPSLTGGGDFGFEDQQAALGWVKRNIAAFGGNPENITIGGRRAAGRYAHIWSPRARAASSTRRSSRAAPATASLQRKQRPRESTSPISSVAPTRPPWCPACVKSRSRMS
jgi:carboxylesterase type B